MIPYIPTKYTRGKFWDSNTYTIMGLWVENHRRICQCVSKSRCEIMPYPSTELPPPLPKSSVEFKDGFPNADENSLCLHTQQGQNRSPRGWRKSLLSHDSCKWRPRGGRTKNTGPQDEKRHLKVCDSHPGLTSNEMFQEEGETVGM